MDGDMRGLNHKVGALLVGVLVCVGCTAPKPIKTKPTSLIQTKRHYAIGDRFRRHIIQRARTLPNAQRANITLRLAKQACEAHDREDGLAILQTMDARLLTPELQHQRHAIQQRCAFSWRRMIAPTCQSSWCRQIIRRGTSIKDTIEQQTHPIWYDVLTNLNTYDRTNKGLRLLAQLDNEPRAALLKQWLIVDVWSQPNGAARLQNMIKLIWHPSTRRALNEAQQRQFEDALAALKDHSTKRQLIVQHTQKLIEAGQTQHAYKQLSQLHPNLIKYARRHRDVAQALWSLRLAQRKWADAFEVSLVLDADVTSKQNEYAHQTLMAALNAGDLQSAQTIFDRMPADDDHLQRGVEIVRTAHTTKQANMANVLWEKLNKQHTPQTEDERLRWMLFESRIAHASGKTKAAKAQLKKLTAMLQNARQSNHNTTTWSMLINSTLEINDTKLIQETMLQFLKAYVPRNAKYYKPLALSTFLRVECSGILDARPYLIVWQHLLHPESQRGFLAGVRDKPLALKRKIIPKLFTGQTTFSVLRNTIDLCQNAQCTTFAMKQLSAQLQTGQVSMNIAIRHTWLRLVAVAVQQAVHQNMAHQPLRTWLDTLPTEYRLYGWYVYLNDRFMSQALYPNTNTMEQLHQLAQSHINTTGARRLAKLILRHFVHINRCDLAWKHFQTHDIAPSTRHWSIHTCTRPQHTTAKIALIVKGSKSGYERLQRLVEAFEHRTTPWLWSTIRPVLEHTL